MATSNHYCYKSKKIAAFTLAEVLITLAIIGVVAAMTIPALKSHLDEEQYKTAFKKSYAEFSQAYKMVRQFECGGSFKSCFTNSNSYWNAVELKNAFAKYMSVAKDCANASTHNCFAPESEIKTYTGHTSNYDNYDHGTRPGFTSNNGSSYVFRVDSMDCSEHHGDPAPGGYDNCGSIYIDVNGPGKPNRFGKDIYYIVYTADRIIPAGAFGFLTTSCIYNHVSNISNDTNGYGCAYKVLNNLPYDNK